MSEFLQQLVNGVTWGSVYALIALGYTMVYGILRLINFAHGDVYMLGAFFGLYAAQWIGAADHPTPVRAFVVLVAAMLGCGAVGAIIERAAYKPVRRSSRLAALITAIGVSLLLENGGILVFGPNPRFFPQIVPSSQISLGHGVSISNQQVIILVVSTGLMFALRFIVLNTRVGKAMRAVSHNHMAAALMGISVDRIITFTFVLGSMLAAAAGVLVALQNPKIDPLMGIMPGLKAFVAAVLGGIGNIPGAVLGGLVMGIAEVLVVGYLSPSYRDAIAFVLLIVILLVRPTGILGTQAAEKV
ncbi:MAG: branched-chain amino acid ABC transporter permease [Candidatus Eisenbacteria bacterium]|uniref:Branched-chain amino acid ABC transporter permease n=1 Tax=Eiseniibacteriota bacterium TaxID=2212470 RepID=A0A538SJ42_UNCEI|nr:MAG: branched-chain amino acid ABC transporter permease [Candidatus Eisenbacteria bacterium]